jgi:hypothetical protein
VRKNYYQLSPGTPGAVHAAAPEATGPGSSVPASSVPASSVEDALVMWAHEIDSPDYAALLDSIERTIPGETVFEDRTR